MQKLVIDSYGADIGDEAIIRGALKALERHTEYGAVIVGNRKSFEKCLSDWSVDISRLELEETDNYVRNDESPMSVFNGRENASVCIAMDRLKNDDDCFSCLSPGNTGALFVASMTRLGLEKGIKSPVLASSIPKPDGNWFCLLDCGASLSCTENDLVKFAHLGSDFAKRCYSIPAPKVGLLSNGRESTKGTELIKKTNALLSESDLNFVGNVESYDLFTDYVDVVVADGFCGNLLLKTIEATASSIMRVLSGVEKQYSSEYKGVFDAVNEAIAEKYELNVRGGAFFLGTKKPIIKMHGCSTEDTVGYCIDQLIRLDMN